MILSLISVIIALKAFVYEVVKDIRNGKKK